MEEWLFGTVVNAALQVDDCAHLCLLIDIPVESLLFVKSAMRVHYLDVTPFHIDGNAVFSQPARHDPKCL